MRNTLIFFLVLFSFNEAGAQESVVKAKPSERIAQLENDLSVSLTRERTMTDEYKRCNDALSDKRRLLDLSETEAGKLREDLSSLRSKLLAYESSEKSIKSELSSARAKNEIVGTVVMLAGGVNVCCLVVIAALLFLVYRKLWPKKKSYT